VLLHCSSISFVTTVSSEERFIQTPYHLKIVSLIKIIIVIIIIEIRTTGPLRDSEMTVVLNMLLTCTTEIPLDDL